MDYARDATIAAVYDEIVRAHGPTVAIEYGEESLTHAELNRRANRVAHHLQAAGVGPDVLVGCLADRSPEMIVALLGILKAGGGYVPLDPAYPAERLRYLVEDTRCAVVIATRAAAQALGTSIRSEIIVVEHASREGQEPTLEQGPVSAATATSIAYVMYTSGSTGMPKGVVAEQRSIVRLVRGTDYCGFGPDETWLHYAPLSFDASTLEIWGALLNGSRLVIAPPRASLAELGTLIRKRHVTSVWLTSGLFNLMVEQRPGDLAGLRQLLAGGDVLSPRHVRMALQAMPAGVLVNGYGPTENTTFTCCHRMRQGDVLAEPVPIGRPIAHTSVYILDQSMQPVAAGEIGELFTGGDGVARGYLNQPDATALKFLPDPFAGQPGARMYRTGDLARWRPDGSIDFLGRVDNQVKILGHRIEPGEIESTIAQHPGVGQCHVHVLADDAHSKRLIAYYTSAGQELAPAALRDFLAERLPRYMMPALLVPLCRLPLNPNGKIDRAALPVPRLEAGPAAIQTLEAGGGTRVEDVIADVWQRATQAPRIGLDDNFFDIGGDSLRLVTVHAELERRLGREIAVMDLFEATTIRALARRLGGHDEAGTRLAADRERAQRQRAAFSGRRKSRH